MIEFKTYKESYLDDQVALIKEVIGKWDWVIWYPNEETLKRNYSQEGFTPETRHYVFDGEKLVGFLSSAIEGERDGIVWGSIHLPFIKKGYEHIEKDLMKVTVKVLEKKGANAIRAIAMPGWGDQIPILERWGFNERLLLSQVTIFPTSTLFDGDYKAPKYIQEIDINKNKELLIKTICKVHSIPKDKFPKHYENMLTDKEFVTGAIIDTEDYSLYGFLTKGCDYMEIPDRLFFTMEFRTEESSDINIESIINEIFKFFSFKAQNAGYKFLWYQITNLDKFDFHKKLNLKFDPCYRYNHKIS
ncbi:MAG: hypothetical protein FK733_13965 [Asgard group archaeon]|nr:hypothetical protein [Asgard group archaeon]